MTIHIKHLLAVMVLMTFMGCTPPFSPDAGCGGTPIDHNCTLDH